MRCFSAKIFFLAAIVFALAQNGCGDGITPEPDSVAGFSGKVSFIGTWPDSITRTHIVMFKDPLLAASDFSAINLRYISLEIPYGITEYNFSSLDSAYVPAAGELLAGEYSYLAVAMSKSTSLSLNRIDWFVAGVYYANSDTTTPGLLVVPENTLVRNINIKCDFNNPPPQPPGGM
ncbi:MAG: hypothetical protein IPM56_06880 [Ignavibacteriales bacterium]|nr:MAG: hypothetical protein IPM56_06880 [Ignavibacteriales bacterium]